MEGNLQGDLKEMSNFKVCPMQLACRWIQHITTMISDVNLKTKLSKLSNKQMIKGQLWNKIIITKRNGR